jgi:DNA-binding LacI/PurR family transcriptional regulator
MTTVDGTPAALSRRPHLKDVARLAGVSFQTVSRALNDGPRVSPETRARVLAAAEELGYSPNVAARALVTGRGTLVVAFVPDTERFDYVGSLRGLEQATREAGLSVVITVLPDRALSRMREVVTQALSQPVFGVVVFNFDGDKDAIIEAIPAGLPAVVIGTDPSDRQALVVQDEYGGGRRAAEHLLALGHQTIHHLSLPDFGRTWPRVRAWEDSLRSAGAPVPERIETGWSVDAARAKAGAVAAAGATAVMCGNDDVAFGLMRGLADLGVRVPHDISVVGFDDVPYARVSWPALTTVRQDFVAIGAVAYRLLDEQVHGTNDGRHEIVPTELIIRESSAAPPAI